MTRPRLNPRHLEKLRPSITGPQYDRTQASGVVHLGIGAFHRAHQAVYVDNLLELGETDWMITGASLRSQAVAQALNPQAGLFTVRATDDTQDHLRVIGSVKDVIAATAQTDKLIKHLAAPTTKLVTLTVTEKGYHVDIATKRLIETSADIAHDISNSLAPVSAPGFLVAGLAARKAAGLDPFTVLSCDNLPHNGEITRIAVLSLAERISPELARWIETEGAFPSSMVDRIVPAVSLSNIDELSTMTGWRDDAMVKTEPFSQWVIEDNFCNDRPKLDRVGVQFTSDVGGWETIKLRMLNGAHSAIAYMGSLAGHTFVSDAVATPEFKRFIHQLWDEIEVTLPPISGFSVIDYRRELFARFENSTLQHRTQQIAMDGSQKIPQRVLAPLYERHQSGFDSPALMAVLASWVKYQFGVDRQGKFFQVYDPLKDRLQKIVFESKGETLLLLRSITALDSIFGNSFQNDRELFRSLCDSFDQHHFYR